MRKQVWKACCLKRWDAIQLAQTRHLALFAMSLVFLVCLASNIALADKTAATAAVANAEDELQSAYRIVREASGSGVNASHLLHQLNVAGNLLGEAEMQLKNENFTAAEELAARAIESLDGIEEEADSLMNSFMVERHQRILMLAMASSAGVVVIIILGFKGWSYVKRWYVNLVLKMKPEVAEPDKHS